jgi:hypothetical protein
MNPKPINKVHLFRTADFNKEEYDYLYSFLEDVAIKYEEAHFFIKHEEAITVPKDTVKSYITDMFYAKKIMQDVIVSPQFSGISEDVYQEYIQKFTGSKHDIASWETMFDIAKSCRNKNKNINSEDHVIILTNTDNERNWFSANDDTNKNGFVHTDQWDYFLPGYNKIYPIAYEIIGLIIHAHMGCSYTELEKRFVHHKSIGCVSDFCRSKTEVNIKIRTGDICDNCLKALKRNVEFDNIYLLLMYLNEIREKTLWTIRYLKINDKISNINLIFQKNNIEFEFVDYNKKMNMGKGEKGGPLHKAIYAYLLLHEEGLPLYAENLSDEQLEELITLYRKVARGKRKEIKEEAASTIFNQFVRQMIDNTKDKEKYGDPLIWGVVGTLNTIIKELVKGDLPLKQYEINSTKNENGISVYKVALNKNRVCKIGSID